MSGASLLLTTYKCTAPSGMVTFVTDALGKVWLQTMPISGLAAAIRQFIPTKSS
jgi:hypothetical protein